MSSFHQAIECLQIPSIGKDTGEDLARVSVGSGIARV